MRNLLAIPDAADRHHQAQSDRGPGRGRRQDPACHQCPDVGLRGKWYDFRGTKLAVTYHPAFLLRDPRQKKEAWKDLQMVMKDLGLKAPTQATKM